MNGSAAREVVADFERLFGAPPGFLVRAPGRINLIGDHTDYSGGLVLPMAIDRAVWIAVRATDHTIAEIHSTHFRQSIQVPLGTGVTNRPEPWAPYVVGVIALLERQGVPLRGCQALIGGDLPPGAGLASSAALEVGVARAMLHVIGQKRSPVGLATLCRQAEHEFARSPCGIMDQLCCTTARDGHAVLIDCRRTVSELVPLNLGRAVFVVIDSGVRHSIAGTEYAARRRQCTAAVDALRSVAPSIRSLRDVTEDRLPSLAGALDETLLRRVRHVVTENARVARAVDALRAGDVDTFGRLMAESHRSLRDDVAVSCEELDHIVSITSAVGGVHGARMTGGGFGGCVIVLASGDAVRTMETAVHESDDGRLGGGAAVFVARCADAVEVIDPVPVLVFPT